MVSPKPLYEKDSPAQTHLFNPPPPPFNEEGAKRVRAYLTRLEAMPSDPEVEQQKANTIKDLAEWPARRAYLAGGKTNSAKKNLGPRTT
jgi:hypothetical protein